MIPGCTNFFHSCTLPYNTRSFFKTITVFGEYINDYYSIWQSINLSFSDSALNLIKKFFPKECLVIPFHVHVTISLSFHLRFLCMMTLYNLKIGWLLHRRSEMSNTWKYDIRWFCHVFDISPFCLAILKHDKRWLSYLRLFRLANEETKIGLFIVRAKKGKIEKMNTKTQKKTQTR